jgi:hypothetical protein
MSTDWLLLAHQMPPRPAYLRVKVWRRLQAVGAVAIKGALYALPESAAARAAFAAVAEEIAAAGGDALVAEARLVGGMSDGEIVSLFQAERDRDYRRVVDDLPRPKTDARPTSARRAEFAAAIRRARKRLADIQAVDFFGAPGREAAEAAIATLEHRLIPAAPEPQRHPRRAELHNRVWVTRRGVHVDRMASAWLIRRFVDPDAKFRFVPGLGYRPAKRELRFDMADAEFTHEGEDCSFETILRRTGLDDPALRAVGDIVHDLDLGDGKFGRPETAGIRTLVAGIIAAVDDDKARIARASALFDDLYESYRRADRPSRRKRT